MAKTWQEELIELLETELKERVSVGDRGSTIPKYRNASGSDKSITLTQHTKEEIAKCKDLEEVAKIFQGVTGTGPKQFGQAFDNVKKTRAKEIEEIGRKINVLKLEAQTKRVEKQEKTEEENEKKKNEETIWKNNLTTKFSTEALETLKQNPDMKADLLKQIQEKTTNDSILNAINEAKSENQAITNIQILIGKKFPSSDKTTQYSNIIANYSRGKPLTDPKVKKTITTGSVSVNDLKKNFGPKSSPPPKAFSGSTKLWQKKELPPKSDQGKKDQLPTDPNKSKTPTSSDVENKDNADTFEIDTPTSSQTPSLTATTQPKSGVDGTDGTGRDATGRDKDKSFSSDPGHLPKDEADKGLKAVTDAKIGVDIRFKPNSDNADIGKIVVNVPSAGDRANAANAADIALKAIPGATLTFRTSSVESAKAMIEELKGKGPLSYVVFKDTRYTVENFLKEYPERSLTGKITNFQQNLENVSNPASATPVLNVNKSIVPQQKGQQDLSIPEPLSVPDNSNSIPEPPGPPGPKPDSTKK